MTNLEKYAPQALNETPLYFDDRYEPSMSWHQEQQELRFWKKPYSVQYQDAIFADLDIRGIEYETHPYEEVFGLVNSLIPGEYYDLDDPWYFSDHIQPQLHLFEQLDKEQKLFLLQEPEVFTMMTANDEALRYIIDEFLADKKVRDPSWETVKPEDLIEYYHFRKHQIEKYANDRLTQLRGEK